MFANAQWQPDRMLLDGLMFRLEQNRGLAWQDQMEHFRFFKTKELIDAYAKFFLRASPRRVHRA